MMVAAAFRELKTGERVDTPRHDLTDAPFRISDNLTVPFMARKILGHIAERPPTFFVPRRMQVHLPAATSLRAPVH